MIHYYSNRTVALSLVACLWGSTQAFVPTIHPPRTAFGPATLTPPSFIGGVPVAPRRVGTTALAMAGQGNLLDRFFRVARSNLNTAVSSLENPEKVIGQAVTEMQVSACVECTVRWRRTEE
jgi:hypothetical protein